MKSKSVIYLISIMILLFSISAFAQEEINVYVDCKMLTIDQPPVMENDRTLVPLRAIFEALNAEIVWDEETQTVDSKKDNIHVRITIDSKKAYVNDAEVELDVPARLINERTLVPIRFVSETFNCKVDWDENAVKIYTPEQEMKARINDVNKPTGEYGGNDKKFKIQINGEYQEYKDALVLGFGPPLLSLEDIAKTLGAEYKKDGERVTVVYNGITSVVENKCDRILVNGKSVKINPNALILKNKMMVPFRSIGNIFNMNVVFDEYISTVKILQYK